MNLSEGLLENTSIVSSWVGIAAAFLALVNGGMLLRSYLRDRPKIEVTLVHPEVYQWFFTLPPRKYQGFDTKRIGFLAYLCIVNRGLRDVSIESWVLKLRTKDGRSKDLQPISIPEPKIPLGESGSQKVLAVLGQACLFHRSDTMARSGDSVSGLAYYTIEFYGHYEEEPIITPGETTAKIEVKTVFGKKSGIEVRFREMPLEQIQSMFPEIDSIT